MDGNRCRSHNRRLNANMALFATIITWIITTALIPEVLTQIGTGGGGGVGGGAGGGVTYRLCVPDVLFPFCQQMINDVSPQGGRIVCTTGNDKIDCLNRIARSEADLMILEPEEMYVAHAFFHDAFLVATEVRTRARQEGSFRYEPVAIVRNSARIRTLSDLRGKRSCHTAFGRTSGWEVPITRLMEKSVMVKYCSPEVTTQERELAAAADFFDQACVPGAWVADRATDRELKRKYPQLCSLCSNPLDCQETDKYAGFRGALRCLAENGGDVAWTRLETVYFYFGGQIEPVQAQSPLGQGRSSSGPSLSVSEYSFLCPDGTSRPLTSQRPCTWAGRPWKAFLVSTRLAGNLLDIQDQITLHHQVGSAIEANPATQPLSRWLTNILEIGRNEVEFRVPIEFATTLTPRRYLDRGNYTLTIEKPTCPNPRVTRFCVQNDAEKSKCMAVRMASIGRRITPQFGCVQGESRKDCMLKIASGQADVMTVDPREAFDASRRYHLTPILSESERFGDEETDAARYTVAVVRKDSGINNIFELRGKRSCHGSISSLSGWNIPITVLRDTGLIFTGQCDFGRALANFFSLGSCIPGAGDPKLGLPSSLCSLCVGGNLDGGLPAQENFCANNELEGFYGDLGSFRCLRELAADVAFTDHLTPILNTDGTANATWAVGLLSENFRLICPIGPARLITEFRQCHWGRIPADKVVTSELRDYTQREEIRLSLLKLSETFHPDQPVLRLFGPYFGIPNLLFKDTSLGLVSLNEADSVNIGRRIDLNGRYINSNKDVVYDQQLSNRFIRDIDSCNGAPKLGSASAAAFIISTLCIISVSLLTFMSVYV